MKLLVTFALSLTATSVAATVACAQERASRPAAAPAASAAAAAPTGDATRGRKLYHDHGCYGCHGFNGETGARDLVGTGSPFIASEPAFKSYLRLRADQAPLLPVTRMPNYPADTLDDAAVRDLFAFVRTFRLDAPAVEDVPTLRAILDSAKTRSGKR